MSTEAVNVGREVTQLHMNLANARLNDDDVVAMFAQIPQHPHARMGSAVDDAQVWTLDNPCPYCGATAGQECREDCATRWDES